MPVFSRAEVILTESLAQFIAILLGRTIRFTIALAQLEVVPPEALEELLEGGNIFAQFPGPDVGSDFSKVSRARPIGDIRLFILVIPRAVLFDVAGKTCQTVGKIPFGKIALHQDTDGQEGRIVIPFRKDIQVFGRGIIHLYPKSLEHIGLGLFLRQGNRLARTHKFNNPFVFQMSQQVDIGRFPFGQIHQGIQGYLALGNLAGHFVAVEALRFQQGELRLERNVLYKKRSRVAGNFTLEALASLVKFPGFYQGCSIQFLHRNARPLKERSLLGNTRYGTIFYGDNLGLFAGTTRSLVLSTASGEK